MKFLCYFSALFSATALHVGARSLSAYSKDATSNAGGLIETSRTDLMQNPDIVQRNNEGEGELAATPSCSQSSIDSTDVAVNTEDDLFDGNSTKHKKR